MTAAEARALSQLPNGETLKGKRDRALRAILLGWGLRRRELAELTLDHIQRRENHWAIVDLVGKAGHVRTVPVPDWVKQTIDGLRPPESRAGKCFGAFAELAHPGARA